MTETKNGPALNPKRRRSDLIALIAALVVLLGVMVHTVSCGTDDIVFPGDIPFTPTSATTPTETP